MNRAHKPSLMPTLQQGLKATAATLIGCYLILAFLAVKCSFTHSTHQHETTSHSLLCAWVCQANPGVSLASSSPVNSPLTLVVVHLATLTGIFLSPSTRFTPSRAPPR